jgi:hypothetical protein
LVLPLLGFKHEAVLAVQVEPFLLACAIAARNIDFALEGISVVLVDRASRIGPGQFQRIAQFREEKLGVGLLGPAGSLPAGNEIGNTAHESISPSAPSKNVRAGHARSRPGAADTLPLA